MERHTETVPKGGSEGQRQDAAVSNIIGTIIVFAFVVILLAIFQVAAVPIWNQSVEFEHSQRVQDDVGQLHDSIVLSATTGRATTQSVELVAVSERRRVFLLGEDAAFDAFLAQFPVDGVVLGQREQPVDGVA